MRQAPPPIPMRPEKEDVVMEEVVEEKVVEEKAIPLEKKGKKKKAKKATEKKEKEKGEQEESVDPPKTPILSSAKLPEQVAESVKLPDPVNAKTNTETKRRFIETNDKVWWNCGRSKTRELIKREPKVGEIQRWGMNVGIGGNKLLLLLPEKKKGDKEYVHQDRKYEAFGFKYGECGARARDMVVWDEENWVEMSKSEEERIG